MSMQPHKLKILGFYHRKIDRFLGRFPHGTTEAKIKRYYKIRGILLSILFLLSFVVLTGFVAISKNASYSRVMILYILSVASVCVFFRLSKMHYIELPQVLALHQRPEVITSKSPFPLICLYSLKYVSTLSSFLRTSPLVMKSFLLHKLCQIITRRQTIFLL